MNDYFTIPYTVRIANIKVIKSNDVIYFFLLTILPITRNGKILHIEETTIPKCNNHTLTVRNCSETEPAFCMASFTPSCALQVYLDIRQFAAQFLLIWRL